VRPLNTLAIRVANARMIVEGVSKLAPKFVAVDVELWDDK
jgi:hypothetical protein